MNLSLTCCSWLHIRIYLCDQIPTKVSDPKTQVSFPGQKHSTYTAVFHYQRKSTACVLNKERSGGLRRYSLTTNTFIFPPAYSVLLVVINLSHYCKLLLSLMSPLEIKVIITLIIPNLGIYPPPQNKNVYPHKSTQMFIVVLFAMVGNWKQHQNAHQQVSELTNRDIYTQWDNNQKKKEKKKERLLIYTKTSTQLKIIMLRGRSQIQECTQYDHIYMKF